MRPRYVWLRKDTDDLGSVSDCCIIRYSHSYEEAVNQVPKGLRKDLTLCKLVKVDKQGRRK